MCDTERPRPSVRRKGTGRQSWALLTHWKIPNFQDLTLTHYRNGMVYVQQDSRSLCLVVTERGGTLRCPMCGRLGLGGVLYTPTCLGGLHFTSDRTLFLLSVTDSTFPRPPQSSRITPILPPPVHVGLVVFGSVTLRFIGKVPSVPYVSTLYSEIRTYVGDDRVR